MIDFGAFCYLDVQKTGSTFVEAFLREHAALPLVKARKHGIITADVHDEGEAEKLYFISCRDPEAQWRSLYFYGCEKKGLVFHLLRQKKLAAKFYDGSEKGLNAWLDLMLRPGAQRFFGSDYARPVARMMGLQSYRFLRLSFHNPAKVLGGLQGRGDLRKTYERDRLHRAVLRTERLNADLADLVRGPLGPHLKSPEAALAALERAEQGKGVNASSNTGGAASLKVAPEIRARLRKREWFLYERLGYGATDGGEGAA